MRTPRSNAPPKCGSFSVVSVLPDRETISRTVLLRPTRIRPPLVSSATIEAVYVRSFFFPAWSNRHNARPAEPAMSDPCPASTMNADACSCGTLFLRSSVAVRTVFVVPSKQTCANRSPARTRSLSCLSHARGGRTTSPLGDHTSTYSHDGVSPTSVAARPPSAATSLTGEAVRISIAGRTSTIGGGGAKCNPTTLTQYGHAVLVRV